jgi:hypothetical protein
MEVIPAVSMALFAPHSGSERKEKLISQMHWLFSNQLWSIFLLTWPAVVQDYSLQTILYSIFLVFLGLVRAFLGPTIFSLLSLLV